MAKATTIKVKLVSTADTGYFYVTKKNSRTMTEKLAMKKYDPVAKKHVNSRKPRSSRVRTLNRGLRSILIQGCRGERPASGRR